jgi:hypothetical protein
MTIDSKLPKISPAMKPTIFFIEKQQFTQKIFKIVLLLISGIFLFAFIQQVVFNHPFGRRPMSDKGIIAAVLFLAIFNLLFYSMKLVTTIDEEAISVRFYPFHFFSKRFEWSQLSDVIIRQYNPMKEYGGWGLRGFGNKSAMTVSGTWLIEVVFVNNQSLLIGTCKPSEAEKALALSGFKKPEVRSDSV